ncbi:MAG: glycosyltransferase 9 family protein [Alphaproteobacteria bacterium]|nr:MAG: glycosyltransferase 9 family protein [Caulobacteraceae bacterium]TPW08110.1 MAG: glycosyltransferase 9 family protein [Alphaproteobacteria bacterium]
MTHIQPASIGERAKMLVPGFVLVMLLLGLGSAVSSLFGKSARWVEPPVAATPAERVLGPVASKVMVGENQGVTGAFVGETYVVANISQPRATFTALAPLPGGAGDFRITARVAVADTQAPDGGAGVVFAHDRQTGAYMAAAIMGDGSVSVFESSPDSFSQTATIKTDGMVRPGFNEMVVTRIAGEVSIKVNGQNVTTHSGGYLAMSDEAGLFANGLGRFTFESFRPQMRAVKSTGRNAMNADSYDTLLARAGALQGAGDLDGALAAFDRALTLEPDRGDGWRAKALALAGAGRFEESLTVLSHGVRVAPNDDRMAGLYITNLREIGRKEDAFAEGQRVIARAGRSIWVLKAVADTWRDRGEYAQAVRHYDRGLAIAPQDTMLMNGKATALFLSRDYAGAAALYERVITLRPGDFTAWLNLAYAHDNLGDREKARAAYGQALAIRPENADALEGRASAAASRADAAIYLSRLEPIDPARAAAARARIVL